AHDARLWTDQIAIVARIAGPATEASVGLFDRLLFRERQNHFLLSDAPARRRQHRLLDAREVGEIRHVHPVQIGDDVERDRPRLQGLSAKHLVEIEGDALAVTNGIYHHQRLTRTQLHDIACREKVRFAETTT